MFIKLGSQIKIPDWTLLKGEFVGSYGPLNLYKIADINYYNKFFGNLNFKILPIVTYYVEILDSCLPHTDPYPCKSALNFIIESGNAKTSFFEKRLHQIDSIDSTMIRNNIDNPNSAQVFDWKDLVEYTNFISYPGEFYLIDTSKIHSVMIDKPHVRKLISWRWDYLSLDLIKNNITLTK